MTDLRQAAQQALEALCFGLHVGFDESSESQIKKGGVAFDHHSRAITALTAALEQQTEPTQWRDMVVVSLVREGIDKHKARELADHFAPQQQAEPVVMRMPRAGDRVICLEDESLGEVVSLTAGGSPDIAFDDGSRGTYMLREFAELFGYVTSPQQQAEPVAFYDFNKGFYWAKPTKIVAPTVVDVPPMPLYTLPPQRPWVGLTPEEILDLFDVNNVYGSKWIEFARTVEQALKAKNT